MRYPDPKVQWKTVLQTKQDIVFLLVCEVCVVNYIRHFCQCLKFVAVSYFILYTKLFNILFLNEQHLDVLNSFDTVN